MAVWLPLAGFILLAWSASIPGAFFGPGPWYEKALRKPGWNPPNWLFGPAWALIFTLMGVTSWLVWRDGGWSGAHGVALALYVLHLPVNAAWSVFFFGLRRPDWAALEVVLLWGSVVVVSLQFWQVTPLAGLLLIPYVLWVSFAGALNFNIWMLNAGRLAEMAAQYGRGGHEGR